MCGCECVHLHVFVLVGGKQEVSLVIIVSCLCIATLVVYKQNAKSKEAWKKPRLQTGFTSCLFVQMRLTF